MESREWNWCHLWLKARLSTKSPTVRTQTQTHQKCVRWLTCFYDRVCVFVKMLESPSMCFFFCNTVQVIVAHLPLSHDECRRRWRRASAKKRKAWSILYISRHTAKPSSQTRITTLPRCAYSSGWKWFAICAPRAISHATQKCTHCTHLLTYTVRVQCRLSGALSVVLCQFSVRIRNFRVQPECSARIDEPVVELHFEVISMFYSTWMSFRVSHHL